MDVIDLCSSSPSKSIYDLDFVDANEDDGRLFRMAAPPFMNTRAKPGPSTAGASTSTSTSGAQQRRPFPMQFFNDDNAAYDEEDVAAAAVAGPSARPDHLKPLRVNGHAHPYASTSTVFTVKPTIVAAATNDPTRIALSDDRAHSQAVPPAPANTTAAPNPSITIEHEDNEDDAGVYLARVLEVLPDADPEHVLRLLEQQFSVYRRSVVDVVVNLLFENPGYPRIDRSNKGKRKRDEADDDTGLGRRDGPAPAEISYMDVNRPYNGGPHYFDLSLNRLFLDFPYIPKLHIRHTFSIHNRLYAPTYFALAEQAKRPILPYTPKTQRSRVTGKGKAREDAIFEEERRWVLLQLAKLDNAHPRSDTKSAEDSKNDDDGEDPDGIECGCCFSTYRFDRMIQCPEAHLFCKSCMVSYAETKLGAHDASIVCMDQSGCLVPFSRSELVRFLTPKLLELYERVTQRRDIEAAGLEGLEECPFCEYKVVMDVAIEGERLFRCQSEECGKVSCRVCKKLDHLPKSCKEAEKDKELDRDHVVEEAMTSALKRNCPACGKAFIKESGCNKMTCPNCYTMSCYVCRKIVAGYDHFVRQDMPVATQAGKCVLWDSVDQRHDTEVKAAATRALEEYKRAHPDMDEQMFKTDLPVRPQAQNPPLQAQHVPHPHMHLPGAALLQGRHGPPVFPHPHPHPHPAAPPHLHHPPPPPRPPPAPLHVFHGGRRAAQAHANVHDVMVQAQAHIHGLPLAGRLVADPPTADLPVADHSVAGLALPGRAGAGLAPPGHTRGFPLGHAGAGLPLVARPGAGLPLPRREGAGLLLPDRPDAGLPLPGREGAGIPLPGRPVTGHPLAVAPRALQVPIPTHVHAAGVPALAPAHVHAAPALPLPPIHVVHAPAAPPAHARHEDALGRPARAQRQANVHAQPAHAARTGRHTRARQVAPPLPPPGIGGEPVAPRVQAAPLLPAVRAPAAKRRRL